MMQQFWDSKYKPTSTALSPQSANSFPPNTSHLKHPNEYEEYLRKAKEEVLAKLNPQLTTDEYVQYCKEEVEWADDAIAWWQQPLQQHKYPNLSRMALNILSIPAMSADVERLFSSAGLTLSDRRNRMGEELLEALECLKSWLKLKEFDIGSLGDTEVKGAGRGSH